MRPNQHDLFLLPRKFTYLVYALLLTGVLILIGYKTDLITLDKEVAKAVSKSAILLAFLILALTKQKDEDELTIRIRLKAFAISFIYGVTLAIVNPIVNFIFDGNYSSDMTIDELLITMLVFYFGSIYFMKRNR